jgi:hypothetical protein
MGAMRGADDAMPWLPFTLPPAQLEGSFTRSDDGWYAPGPGPPPPPPSPPAPAPARLPRARADEKPA